MNRGNLNIQICIYPFLDGGIYLTFSKREKMIRVSIALIDLRLWWDGKRMVAGIPPAEVTQ